jgi:hypothetical protein
MKGYAIIGLLVLHALIYGIWHTAETALSILPVWLLVFLAPLIIVATWGGGFALLSGFVNTFNAVNKMSKGVSRKMALQPIIINSIIIILLDPIRCYFFVVPWNRLFTGEMGYSLFLDLIVNGNFQWPPFEQIMSPGALPVIGIAGLLCALVLSFVYDKNGKTKENKMLVPLILLIAFIIVLFGEPLSHAMYALEKEMFFRGGFLKILAYPLVLLGGDILSFLPNGAYAFLGMAFALIYKKESSKDLVKRYGRYISLLSFVLFLIFLFVMIKQLGDTQAIINELFGYRIQPRALTFFNISIISLILSALLRYYEYDEQDLYIKKANKTVWVRRWGMLTLSLYMLDGLVNTFFSKLFHTWFGDYFLEVDAFMTNVPAILLYSFIVILFWFTLVWAWEKISFKGSMESLVVWVGGLFRKNKSQRLNVQKNLYMEDH